MRERDGKVYCVDVQPRRGTPVPLCEIIVHTLGATACLAVVAVTFGHGLCRSQIMTERTPLPGLAACFQALPARSALLDGELEAR